MSGRGGGRHHDACRDWVRGVRGRVSVGGDGWRDGVVMGGRE